MKFTKFAATAVMAVAAISANATLVGTNSGGQLLTIDETTGVATQFGSLGTTAVGAAYNPLTDTYYARSFNQLYTFDLAGNVSFVGSSGSGITGLTFDATFSTLYSVSQGSSNFFAIDPLTGAASFIGNLGLSTPLGLSTDSTGQVFTGTINGDIYSINTTTGTATFVTNAGAGLTSIAFDANDTLWGVTLSGDFLRVDLLGTPSNVGGVGGFGDIRGLTFSNPIAAVPAPAGLMLLVSGLMALVIGRRRTAL